MTILESICDQVAKTVERKVMFMTLPQREELRKLLLNSFQPVCTEQATIKFSEPDALKNAEQAQQILELLKSRRSAGATNVELAKLALKYTSRLSELRQDPHFYHISCERVKGSRVTIYRLNPTEW
jgi:hypothetical protein